MKKRTFLVTGATKGIGRALSNRLAAAGHHVVGLARRTDDPSFPGTLLSVDLGDREATDKCLKAAAERFAFDGVVNNVGFVRLANLGDINLDDLEASFRINLNPAVQTVQAILPNMRKQGWGRVVNVSSLTILGVRQRSAYAAAKAAMVTMTRTWALELADAGITVNAVAPGPVETEMFRENSPVGSEAEQRFLSLIPMKRLGKPHELAAGIEFLLSEDAGFITGQTLFIDGGGSIGKASL
ncbi:SDR family oxidoreductase [Burkholderia multivorans]|uniref:SDR family oxidoreductase n=1 Tax=Burkholderia multivorans TaxID=87883 RepID=UPI00143EC5A0|nr:SDR family oxidoreductase [Burkholderia multivorans]MBU9464675.1 SDR family oxidoreductase [Burkholderia multivorans]MCA8125728.1 SDR family oxidoreductase [Burkholderia multivorans]QIX19165.1 SDR family oxidoreductase [Burkholderia multivorans]